MRIQLETSNRQEYVTQIRASVTSSANTRVRRPLGQEVEGLRRIAMLYAFVIHLERKKSILV